MKKFLLSLVALASFGFAFAGDGSEANPYTVEEILAMDPEALTAQPAWVKGTVVGSFTGKALDSFSSETGSGASASNLAIAAAAGETTTSNMVPVQLPVGVRADLSLQNNAILLGREISLYGTLEKYFGACGLKNVSKYTGVPEPEVAEVATLTDFIDEQGEGFYRITGEVTVTHQSGKYLFITDGTSNLEVYGDLPYTYKNGDRLSNIIGKFGYYNEMPQMTPKAESFGAPTEGTPVAPAEVTLDNVSTSQYVVVKNVNIVADGTNWNVTDGTTTKQLFNRFNIDGIAALDGVTIIGVGAVYGEKAQLFPISIEGGTPGQGGGDDPDTPDTPDTPDVPEGGVTINATDFTIDGGTGTASADGYTVTLAKSEGGTAPFFHEKTQAIRLYANGTLTVSGAKIAKIVFTLASDAKYRYTTFTPSVGTLNPAQAAEDTQITWEGDATEVTFTVGEKATLGSDGETKAGQIRFASITIYDESSAISEIRFDNDGSAVIYNLQGRRLSAPERGINIINGQKVLVK